MPRSPHPSLTIRELAKLAGVSKSTASLAMQNHPRLSDKTRQRVREIAEKHGYTPDPLTSTLMSHLRIARKRRDIERLAYMTWWNAPEEWRSNRNCVDWFDGASSRAEALGYELEHVWGKEPGMTSTRLSKVLYTRAIRGVIVTPLLRPHGHLSLDWEHLAPAAIAYTVAKPNLHRASHFHHNGITLALRRLKYCGYQRIGLANLADQIERGNHGWLAGYLVYEQNLPSKQHIPPLLQRNWDKKKFASWLERHKPDAVVSNSDVPLKFLIDLGYKVPKEIGYANLDVSATEGNLAGVDQQQRMIASAAVDLVVAQLQRNECGLPACPKTIHLDGVWRDGATVRRPETGR